MLHAKKLLSDARTFGDLIFETKGGKGKLYAHSVVLGAACDALLPQRIKEQLQSRKPGKVKHLTIEISHEKPWCCLLEYLYTGVARFSSITSAEAIEVYKMAELYKIDRLAWLCKSHFMETIKVDNVCTILKEAHDLKSESVKLIAMSFAFSNYAAFISDKEGVKKMGVDLFQEVVSAYAQKSAGSPRYNVELGPEPPELLKQHYREMYERMLYPDASAVCANGEKVFFHRAILALQSGPLQAYLSRDVTDGQYDFKTLSASAFKALLRFAYYGDEDIAPLLACELVPFSRAFEMTELSRVCRAKLLYSASHETALEILKQCCQPGLEGFQDVAENAVQFVCSHLPELDLSDLQHLEPRHGHHIAMELLHALQARLRANPPALPPASASATGSRDSGTATDAAAATAPARPHADESEHETDKPSLQPAATATSEEGSAKDGGGKKKKDKERKEKDKREKRDKSSKKSIKLPAKSDSRGKMDSK